ncbi:uncharacterized protein LOC124914916 isoform X2 [Impatiens glandulifera]|uniref:uncharacterized protein LOC124914916 isoform X2 n=1 Tax=Impatiens glandulifera TaxID=253017 RepID=UPI001FB10AAA|nr:uncharacterized protein LOC124914916 isoform X2 [Impatiens glandulifera]
MAALSNSIVSSRDHRFQFLSVDKGLTSNNLVIIPASQRNTSSLKSRREFTVRASGDGGRPSSGGRIFVSGFVLGGVVVGALGCIFAPQISKALAETDRKDLMRKLPKFIYDEDKALERTRKILSEKIEQLNAAIDNVSTQLRAEDAPDGTAAVMSIDEVEASI